MSFGQFKLQYITNIMFTRSQNYTNMVVGEHEIQTFKVMVVWCCF